MLNCAEQVQIQKYKTRAYKTLKTVGVQIIMLKQPTKHKKNTHKNPYTVSTYTKITPTIQLMMTDRHMIETRNQRLLHCGFYCSESACTSRQVVSVRSGRYHRWSVLHLAPWVPSPTAPLLPHLQRLPTETVSLESKHAQIQQGEQNTQTDATQSRPATMAVAACVDQQNTLLL